MATVRVFAPAKINLTLHVTGRRDDGYHELDSLVAFAPVGDEVVIQGGNVLSLTVEGPEAAGVPADLNNLALRAAGMAAQGRGFAMTLTKYLPVASGIGGGSTDAAAAFRGILVFGEEDDAVADGLWAMPDIMLETHARSLLSLGADVPMCLWPAPARIRGIGERIEHLALPPLPAVLVNPRVAVSTPAVFDALRNRDNPPMPDPLPDLTDSETLISFLAECRSDLEVPAIATAPAIGSVLDALRGTEGCRLARMSGSGATCFGLFATVGASKSAAKRLISDHPDWWVAECVLGDQSRKSMPVVS